MTKEASWLSEAEELITNPADLGVDDLGTGRDDIRELVMSVLAANGLTGHKTIADALHRPRRQLAAYLRRRDLTNGLSSTLWKTGLIRSSNSLSGTPARAWQETCQPTGAIPCTGIRSGDRSSLVGRPQECSPTSKSACPGCTSDQAAPLPTPGRSRVPRLPW